MPFDVWFDVLTLLSPWTHDVDQSSCWCLTCFIRHLYLEIGMYQAFIQPECLIYLKGGGRLSLQIILWGRSA